MTVAAKFIEYNGASEHMIDESSSFIESERTFCYPHGVALASMIPTDHNEKLDEVETPGPVNYPN